MTTFSLFLFALSKNCSIFATRMNESKLNEQALLYPMLFEPNLHTVVWGGSQLRPYKGMAPSDEPIGESWEVSAVPTSMSVVSNGLWKGLDLGFVLKEMPESILGKAVNRKYHSQLPLLVKFIIKAEKGAHLYAGFKQEITPYEYQKRVADGTITEVLADHQVKAGDVFYLPAGRVHAICGGILLAEVQQSSDVTYRIFDYNRPGLDGKPRELHTELAAQALDFHVEQNYRTVYPETANRATQIIDTPYFDVRVMEVSKPFHRDLRKYDSFIITMCIEGDCVIHVRSTGDEVLLKAGHSTLIPAAIADFDVLPQQGKTRILDAFIDNRESRLATMLTRFFHFSET